MRSSWLLTGLLALAFSNAPGLAQTPVRVGGEFAINTFPTGVQERPAVASLTNGNLVVAWQSLGQDGSGTGVYFQRLNPSGQPLGVETRANTTTIGDQSRAVVAALTNGQFAIAWQSRANLSSPSNIYVQRFSATGAKVGGEILVSPQTQGHPFNVDAAIASLPNGGFVVVWAACTSTFCPAGLTFGQRFNAAGAKLGGAFRLDTFGAAALPRVASYPNGTFVTVWQSLNQDSNPGHGIYAQRFKVNGAKIGTEFLVNTRVISSQVTPAVAILKGLHFVVAWDSFLQDGSGNGIYMQRFSPAGARLGGEQLVNSPVVGPQTQPAIAALGDGGFVVLWSTDDGSFNGLRGRRYTSAGAPLGNPFRVNTATSGIQDEAAVAGYAADRFIAVWTTDVQLNVSGQRYRLP
jgi:hypothetical protein